MINLGSYSGKDCPEVRYKPGMVDRVLEVVALLVLLVLWFGIYWLYMQQGGALGQDVWMLGGSATISYVILVLSSYAPVRFFNFPVRVDAHNIGVQYLLAVRLLRVINILAELMLLAIIVLKYNKIAFIYFNSSILLLILALAAYFIIARRYK